MLHFWPGIHADYNTALPQLSDALRGAVLSAVCVGGVLTCAFQAMMVVILTMTCWFCFAEEVNAGFFSAHHSFLFGSH